jgi:hypothetical protein
MSFSFKHLTKDQIKEVKNRSLLKDGYYPFTVFSMENHISREGKQGLKVVIRVHTLGQNDSRLITDYFSKDERMMEKLEHFCESIGQEDAYAKDELIFKEFIDRSGVAKVGVKKGTMKEDGTTYPDQNNVKDYVKSLPADQKKVEPEFKDDIKF